MTLQNGTQQDEKDSRLIKLGRTFNNFFFNGKKKNMRDESKSTGVFYDIDQTFLRFLQFLGYIWIYIRICWSLRELQCITR